MIKLEPGQVLSVRKWKEVFEKSDAKKLKHLSWVSVPTGFESNGLQMLFDDFGERAAEMFGVWSLLIKVAATSSDRGRLGGSQGKAYSTAALSRMMMGVNPGVIDELIEWCVTRSGWLEVATWGEPREIHETPVNHEENAISENLGDSPKISRLPDRTGPDITQHYRPAGKNARPEIVGELRPEREVPKEQLEELATEIKSALRITNRLNADGRLAVFRTARWLAGIESRDREQAKREIIQLLRSEKPAKPWRFLFGVCRSRDPCPESFSCRWDESTSVVDSHA